MEGLRSCSIRFAGSHERMRALQRGRTNSNMSLNTLKVCRPLLIRAAGVPRFSCDAGASESAVRVDPSRIGYPSRSESDQLSESIRVRSVVRVDPCQIGCPSHPARRAGPAEDARSPSWAARGIKGIVTGVRAIGVPKACRKRAESVPNSCRSVLKACRYACEASGAESLGRATSWGNGSVNRLRNRAFSMQRLMRTKDRPCGCAWGLRVPSHWHGRGAF